MFIISFIGKISKRGNRYHIEIPEEALANVGDVIKQLYEKEQYVLVLILPIHGTHRMYRQVK